jgi:hypothetical protein
LKRVLISALLLGVIAQAQAADAEIVQEFGYKLRDVKSYGGFTVDFRLHAYDTTGAVLPPLRSAFLRLPKGATIRREFLKDRFLCNVKKLTATKDPSVCRNAEIGRGTVLVDARPLLTEGVPAKIYLFLARGTERKAVASIVILGLPDMDAPVVRDNSFLWEYKDVRSANIYNAPTPDRRFGYKLVLPTGPIRGVEVSLAEVDVSVPGLTLSKRRRVCTRKRAGHCTRRRVETKKLYWFTIPRCPSGGYPFQGVFTYEGMPPATHDVSVSCSEFSR